MRRELVAASAEPLILSLLEQGELEWTDGMLYPVLHRMERKGWIKSRWAESETGRKRKYYSLKEDGRKAHKKQREQWLKVHSVLAGLWKEKYV